MSMWTGTAKALALSAVVGVAALSSAPVRAEGALKALNMFSDMVGAMTDVAAAQQQAAAPQPKCWTEERKTKTAGKVVTKTLKVCE